MNILEDNGFREEILSNIAKREFHERTGVHGSDLIYCLNKMALKKLNPLPDTEEEILMYSIGWSTQRWLTGTFDPDTEYVQDGITITPDMVLDCPWELKATYQSSSKPIEESTHWIRQLMSQCYVTGTTTAHLSRFGIMGDWRWMRKPKEGAPPSSHPTLQCWRFDFTPEELARHWDWMLSRKEQFESILKSKLLMPKALALGSGMDWECDKCSRATECAERINNGGL